MSLVHIFPVSTLTNSIHCEESLGVPKGNPCYNTDISVLKLVFQLNLRQLPVIARKISCYSTGSPRHSETFFTVYIPLTNSFFFHLKLPVLTIRSYCSLSSLWEKFLFLTLIKMALFCFLFLYFEVTFLCSKELWAPLPHILLSLCGRTGITIDCQV